MLTPPFPSPSRIFGCDVGGGVFLFLLTAVRLVTVFIMVPEDRVSLPTLKLLLVGDSAVGKSRCVGGGKGHGAGRGLGMLFQGEGDFPRCFRTTHLLCLFPQSFAEIHRRSV